jgi:hypothetical protein
MSYLYKYHKYKYKYLNLIKKGGALTEAQLQEQLQELQKEDQLQTQLQNHQPERQQREQQLIEQITALQKEHHLQLSQQKHQQEQQISNQILQLQEQLKRLQQENQSTTINQPIMEPPMQPPPMEQPMQQSPYGSPVQQSPYGTPVQQSPYGSPVQQSPMEQPMQQSPYGSPVQQSPMQPPMQQPLMEQLMQQPPMQPPMEQPMQPPPMEQPMQPPMEQQPIQQPMQPPPYDSLIQSPMQPSPYGAPVQQSQENMQLQLAYNNITKLLLRIPNGQKVIGILDMVKSVAEFGSNVSKHQVLLDAIVKIGFRDGPYKFKSDFDILWTRLSPQLQNQYLQLGNLSVSILSVVSKLTGMPLDRLASFSIFSATYSVLPQATKNLCQAPEIYFAKYINNMIMMVLNEALGNLVGGESIYERAKRTAREGAEKVKNLNPLVIIQKVKDFTQSLMDKAIRSIQILFPLLCVVLLLKDKGHNKLI